MTGKVPEYEAAIAEIATTAKTNREYNLFIIGSILIHSTKVVIFLEINESL